VGVDIRLGIAVLPSYCTSYPFREVIMQLLILSIWFFSGLVGYLIRMKGEVKVTLEDVLMLPACILFGPLFLLIFFFSLVEPSKVVLWRKK
jgi:hypothetical protein